MAEIKAKGYNVPGLVRKGTMLNINLENAVEDYYYKAIYPKQSLLADERGQLSKLKTAVGILGKRGMSQLPMDKDSTDRIFEMLDN